MATNAVGLEWTSISSEMTERTFFMPSDSFRSGTRELPRTDIEADTSQEQSADKTYPIQTASTFETEDFIVEVPDFLEGKFSVEKQEGAVTKWLFKTDVWKSDNLVYGGVLCVADSDIDSKHVSHFGCTSSGKYVYSDVGVQGREDIFYTSPNNGGGTLATVTLK